MCYLEMILAYSHIFGRSQRAQAEFLIEHVAHPDARDWLREHAAALGLRPRSAVVDG